MSSRSRSSGAAPGVAFSKYSSFGNHFVLVDEIGQPALSERRKRAFARRAADACAGIGADNVIFLQPFDDKSLAGIRGAHRQSTLPDVAAAAAESPCFIARFFEPNGDEFLTCGNGLTCIANHLVRTYGIASARVLVEVPSQQPRFCAVEYPEPSGRGEVHLQWDLSRIEDFVRGSFVGHRERGLLFFSRQPMVAGASPWMASGLLVYSGEPHMVLFQRDSTSSFAWPAALAWEWTLPDLFADSAVGANGTKPLAAIGMHANRPRGRDFPAGINVSVARLVDGGSAIEYRTFERGILHETLACGTAALAIAVAARRLGLAGDERVRLMPALGRRHPRYRGAEIVVRHRDDGTSSMSSQAEHVFSGTMPE